jgi:monolysocardiolipin acyltransferase
VTYRFLGRGLEQEGMKMALEKLNEGAHVHIFPEGKVNQMGKLLPVRWGVGKLVADAKITPAVLPFYHIGNVYTERLYWRSMLNLQYYLVA